MRGEDDKARANAVFLATGIEIGDAGGAAGFGVVIDAVNEGFADQFRAAVFGFWQVGSVTGSFGAGDAPGGAPTAVRARGPAIAISADVPPTARARKSG